MYRRMGVLVAIVGLIAEEIFGEDFVKQWNFFAWGDELGKSRFTEFRDLETGARSDGLCHKNNITAIFMAIMFAKDG